MLEHVELKRIYQYAVKVIQGAIAEDSKIMPISPGMYFTSVNIHNPWRKNVKYFVKVAVSGANGETGPITQFNDHILGPDATTEYDYAGFGTLLNGLPPFLEGYFVIESSVQLDVVGVYTGADARERRLGAMHMERVPARVINAVRI